MTNAKDSMHDDLNNPYRASGVAASHASAGEPFSPALLEMLRGQVRTLQIIVFALVSGATSHAIYVYVISVPPRRLTVWTFDLPPSNLAMLVFGAVSLVMAVILRGALSRTAGASGLQLDMSKVAPNDEWPVRILRRQHTSTIISCALAESGAFANNLGYALSGNGWHLVMSGAAIAFILLQFPTLASTGRRIRDQMAHTS